MAPAVSLPGGLSWHIHIRQGATAFPCLLSFAPQPSKLYQSSGSQGAAENVIAQ